MATYSSNLITAGQGTKSIVPGAAVVVSGSVAIPASTTLSQVTPDVIRLFYMPGPQSYLRDLQFQIPILDSSNTLRMSLGDGTNTLIASTAITTWNAAQYYKWPVVGTTVVGLADTAVATYSVDTLIQFSVVTTSGAATAASIITLYFSALIYGA